MKSRYTKWTILLVTLIFTALLIPVPLMADSSPEGSFQFTIAPPPVGYPVFEPGVTVHSVRGSYLSITSTDSSADWRFDGLSFSYTKQKTETADFLYTQSSAAGVLFGDITGMSVTSVPLLMNFTPVLRLYARPDLDILGFGSLGANALITVSQWDAVDLKAQSLNLSLIPALGAQANIGLGEFVLSPYGIYSYSFGGYIIEYSGDYYYSASGLESTSGSLDPYGSMVIGFDLLYKPYNVSLSSMFRKEDNVDIFSISLGYSFSTAE